MPHLVKQEANVSLENSVEVRLGAPRRRNLLDGIRIVLPPNLRRAARETRVCFGRGSSSARESNRLRRFCALQADAQGRPSVAKRPRGAEGAPGHSLRPLFHLQRATGAAMAAVLTRIRRRSFASLNRCAASNRFMAAIVARPPQPEGDLPLPSPCRYAAEAQWGRRAEQAARKSRARQSRFQRVSKAAVLLWPHNAQQQCPKQPRVALLRSLGLGLSPSRVSLARVLPALAPA